MLSLNTRFTLHHVRLFIFSQLRCYLPRVYRRSTIFDHVNISNTFQTNSISYFKKPNARMTNLTVTVQQGKIKGKVSNDYLGGTYYSFLGIPYAKSPTGDLRFKAPVPAEPWTDIKDCTKEGNECPSLHMFFEYHVGIEEDCLNLNVHTKEIPNEKNMKPVMVWIHGGAFMYGSNRSELFGPDYLMSQDIVLVLINYRLGVFGFLSLDDASLNVPGNNGLKDMVLALKWVKQNIKKFGGDPNNVTIFGESAGSASVHYLVLSPMAKGLFEKAICQSGASLNSWAQGKDNGKIMAKQLGYAEKDEKLILEKLRKEPAKNLVNAQFKIEDVMIPKVVRAFAPVVEKPTEEPNFLTENPLTILKNGTFNKVPMIIGYNSEEGVFYEILRRTRYLKLPKHLELELPHDVPVELGSEKSKELGEKLKKFYFKDRDISEDTLSNLYTLKTDNCFAYGITKSVLHQRTSSPEPIYFYRMSLDGPLNMYKRVSSAKHIKTLFLCYFLMKVSPVKSVFHSLSNTISARKMEGVAHADDLGYFFKMFMSPKIVPGSKEEFYIKRFLRLWTNFAKYGNPTPEKDELLNNVIWDTVSLDNVNLLDLGEKLSNIPDPDIERIKFWDTIYEC